MSAPRHFSRARFSVHSHGRSPRAQGRRWRRLCGRLIEVVMPSMKRYFAQALEPKRTELFWLKPGSFCKEKEKKPW